MKVVYFGPLWDGGTALQRSRALAEVKGVDLISIDVTNGQRDLKSTFYSRVRWKLGWPVDALSENKLLRATARTHRPDAIVVDNSKVLSRDTLLEVKRQGVALIYYSPDDIMADHFLKWPLRRSLRIWDIVFTTKTFNMPELRAAGVCRPILIGKAFDPSQHRPMSAQEVGAEFESYDVVFVGAFERERFLSLLALADAGLRVLVHGAPARLSGNEWTVFHPNLTVRGPAYSEDYTRVSHHGKISLCFLRKINRDRITQRSVEIPAMARPMLAEKTEEHDAHFVDGVEFEGFRNDVEMIAKAKALLADPDRRALLAKSGRQRCLRSGYSTLDRACQMVCAIEQVVGSKSSENV